jgi:DNA-binding transcriptional LysR family regulator
MDRLEAMAILLAVVDEGSISAGARKLRLPLPSVSRKIGELERHLGSNLLIRTCRRVHLTPAGRLYVEHSRQILERINEAERLAAGEYQLPCGELSVSAPPLLGSRYLLPLVTEFLSEHAMISLRLDLTDRVVNLADEPVDIALRIGKLPDSDLRASRLGESRSILCASPTYLDRLGMPRTPAELKSHQAILLCPAGGGTASPVGGNVPAGEMQARLLVNSVEGAIAAAVAGAGIVRVMSYQVADEVRSNLLVPFEACQPQAAVPISLVYHLSGLVPLKMRAFLDWAAPRLRAALAGLDDLPCEPASPIFSTGRLRTPHPRLALVS